MEQMRFHVLGLVHLPTSEKYMGCAFTQKNVKLCKMLLDLGHEVFLYGAEGSDSPCTEFIQTHTLKEIRDTWGDGDNRYEIGYDWETGQFRHDFNTEKTPLTLRWYDTTVREIFKRRKDDDFLIITQGVYQKPVGDKVKLPLTVETGIGYKGSYAPYRGFESAYIQNFTYGSEHPRQSINGNYYDRVIGNYFDKKDFVFSEKPSDDEYYLYIGRMIIRKGVDTAVKATQAIGAKLKLVGQLSGEIKVEDLPEHCEFLGYADKDLRNELMGGAIATFTPTTYLEPFAGTHVESMLCGTPVITTDFGVFGGDTFIDGCHGFKCNTLDDFVRAAKDAKKLDRKIVRENGERYLMDNVKWEYQRWFEDLMAVYESSQKAGVKGWHRVKDKDPEWRKHTYSKLQ